MPDYTNGKVYKITSGDLTYIGSTCEPTLAKRLAKHVGNYKVWKNGKSAGCSSFQLIETGQYEITLIELCPCKTKDELTARERFHIESTLCVNEVLPGRTMKEWYDSNKEILSKKYKLYRDVYQVLNKEAIAEKKKTKYEANKETILEKNKAYRDANKDAISERRKAKYRLKNLNV
jgi:hypothetical protein